MISALIVDDEDLSRYAARKLLSDLYLDVSVVGEAVNGREAVELARELRPDLVIMDVRLPGLDGLEAARRVAEVCRRARIVIVSAYDDFTYAQKALNLGLAGYLLKPLSAEDSRATLDKVLADIRASKAGIAGSSEVFSDDEMSALATREPKRVPPNPVEDSRALERSIRDCALEGTEPGGAVINALVACWMAEDPGLQALKERLSDFLFALRSRFRERRVRGFRKDIPLLPLVEQVTGAGDVERSLAAYIKHQVALGDASLAENDPAVHLVAAMRDIPLPLLSLDSLAERLRLSPEHVSRVFKETLGENFVEAATRLRLDESCRLLRIGAGSIEEISGKVGYGDSTYFSRLFKRKIGLTPSEWRRRNP